MSTVTDVLSSAIRGVIVAPRGKKLVIADLSNIEGRMLAWLSGEEWKLQAFRDFDTFQLDDAGQRIPDGKGDWLRKGHDLYKLAYAKAFRVNPEAVDKAMRQIGKVMELALGYKGGVGAFLTFAAVYGIDLEAMGEQAATAFSVETWKDAEDFLQWMNKKKGFDQSGLSDQAWLVCESFKRLWREAHPETSSWWKDMEDTCVMAVNHPGTTLSCRRHKVRRDGAWLRIMLPSGRYLCYPSPQVDDAGKLSYMGINQYSRQWCRLRTYGGKLVENITQAAARDVLASSMQPIEDAGYEIVLTVHDEIIAEAPDSDEFNSDHLAALMSTVPSWANGLPLAAAGFEAYRYRKD